MAYQISDACVSCGACESQCPVGAISMGDGKFEIDADKCIDCGSCAAHALQVPLNRHKTGIQQNTTHKLHKHNQTGEGLPSPVRASVSFC